jgi:hypothetical protein
MATALVAAAMASLTMEALSGVVETVAADASEDMVFQRSFQRSAHFTF